MEKLNLLKRLDAFFEQHKIKRTQKIRRELKKKIKALFLATYDYCLTMYLIDVAKTKKVDLPYFEYTSGRTICTPALNKALSLLDECVLQQGIKKVDECYKSLLKNRQKVLRGC